MLCRDHECKAACPENALHSSPSIWVKAAQMIHIIIAADCDPACTAELDASQHCRCFVHKAQWQSQNLQIFLGAYRCTFQRKAAASARSAGSVILHEYHQAASSLPKTLHHSKVSLHGHSSHFVRSNDTFKRGSTSVSSTAMLRMPLHGHADDKSNAHLQMHAHLQSHTCLSIRGISTSALVIQELQAGNKCSMRKSIRAMGSSCCHAN